MPKVSVVIPTYNRAHFITETIQSVLDQSFRDFEIIVVNDGSTDNTKQIVSAFPVRYYWQENQGVVAAANRGFELCRGEYIAFLGSDDVLLEKALEKGVQVLDRHPEVAFSYGQAYLIDESGRVFGLRKQRGCSYVRDGSEEIRKFVIRGNYIPSPTVMVRRSCLFDVGLYNPAFRYGSEDLDLFVRLAKRYAVAYIAEPLVKYRIHSGRISAAREMDEEEKSKSRILEGLFNDAELRSLLLSQRPKAYYHLHLRLARHAYAIGDIKNTRDHLFRALKIHPREFFKSLWLPWIYQFAKTWIPLPVLHSVRGAIRYLRMVLWCKFHRFHTIDKGRFPVLSDPSKRGRPASD